MIVKFFLAGLLSLGVTFLASSQDISIYSGVSQASMKDLKLLQKFIADQIPVQYEFTQRFPAYWLYGFSATWVISEKGKVGINAYTTSTGARSSYSDYSGKTRQDYLLKCFGVAAHYDHRIYEKEKFEVSLFSQLGVNSTKFGYEEYFQLGTQSTSESLTFKSINLMVELGCEGKYFFYKKLFLESKLGYQLNQQAPLKDKDGNKILIANTKIVAADWSGFKLSAGIGVRL